MGGLGLKYRKLRWRQTNRGSKGVAYIGMWACAVKCMCIWNPRYGVETNRWRGRMRGARTLQKKNVKRL